MNRTGLLDMSKPADRKKAAGLLADYGRGNDTRLAHVTAKEEEILKERGGAGTRNPHTGLLEFYDSEPGEGSGIGEGTTQSDPGPGPGGTADPMGTGYDYTPSPSWSPPDLSPDRDEGDRARAAATAAAPGAGPFSAGTPATHGYDLATPAMMANLFAKVATLPVPFAGLMQQGVRAARAAGWDVQDDYSGLGASNIGDGVAGSQFPGLLSHPLPSQQSQQPQPSDIAQQALRRAFVYQPQAYNSWQGNRFIIPPIPSGF